MEIGKAIQVRRNELKLTLEDLAKRSRVSRAMLSDIERGLKNPTIKLLCQIAEGLGCSVSELLGEPSALPGKKLGILRRDERQRLIDPSTGVERQLLSPPMVRRGLEIIWYIIPPGQHTGAFPPHQPGVEEHLTVVQGALECHLGEQEVLLAEGDSLFFQADVSHDFYNPGATPCTYFLVINSNLTKSAKL